MIYDRIRVLVLSTTYLPGFKTGGPIRSVSGMIESLGDEFDFRVLTLDRDMGDKVPYPGIVTGVWTPVGKAKVMYLPPNQVNLRSVERLVCETPHDVVYLGGAFDPTLVLRFLFLRRFGRVDWASVMLAPQGVFSQGALSIKRGKKKLFLSLAKRLGLYGSLTWHVSTPYERHDVCKALRLHTRPHFMVVAPDISAAADDSPPIERHKCFGRLQVAFLSRISPMKNLDGALRILQGVDIPLDFHIYGPAEDPSYWRICERELRKLPPHVKATYHGPVDHSGVAAVMRSHDLFFLPTHGENFGHVIIEALREGCPALITNRTAFRNIEKQNAGWDLPPDDVAAFRQVIAKCAAMSDEQWQTWSRGARRLAAKMVENDDITDVYRTAFRKLAARAKTTKAA